MKSLIGKFRAQMILFPKVQIANEEITDKKSIAENLAVSL